MIFKIDTSIVDRLNPIITLVIIVIMLFSLTSLKKNTKDSLITFGICGFLLYIINDVNSFVNLITQLASFVGGVFSG